jgi:uncharacterized protein (TIGR00661 family)
MKIIYAVCSWGLGHATRSLPIIRKLLQEEHTLTLISQGRSLDLLKSELGKNADYVEIPDYPMLLSENARQFMAKSMIYWPVFIKKIESGLIQLNKILNKNSYDLIISDARYDMYSKKIPSFFMSHQMRIMNPLRIKIFESGSELFNQFFFKRFSAVLVPDFKEESLSGDLSHNLRKIDENQIHYIGVLSDFNKQQKKKDIDYLISISGPEPQRSYLEKTLVDQIPHLDGTIAITLGKTEKKTEMKKDTVTTYSYLSRKKREELLNRAKLVISRSGYSTIMDLGVIGTRALIIPTPGQIEQEYLAQYHHGIGSFFSVQQNNIQLTRDIAQAIKAKGITRKCVVSKTVENVLNLITEYT